MGMVSNKCRNGCSQNMATELHIRGMSSKFGYGPQCMQYLPTLDP